MMKIRSAMSMEDPLLADQDVTQLWTQDAERLRRRGAYQTLKTTTASALLIASQLHRTEIVERSAFRLSQTTTAEELLNASQPQQTTTVTSPTERSASHPRRTRTASVHPSATITR